VSLSTRLVLTTSLALSGACRGPDVHQQSPSPQAPVAPLPVATTASPDPSVPPATVSSPSRAASPQTAWSRSNLPRVQTDWCIDSVDTLDEETCVVVPEQPTSILLVYFHGIVPPTRESAQKTNYQTVVANFARRASVVALMPKGRQGFAPAANPGWWGWPTTEAGYQEHAKALVDVVSQKKKMIGDALGISFSQTYVAGSSSGAYFVAALALHGGFPADGFAAISGGGGRKTPELGGLARKPFYIGYGSYDSVGPSARALADVLRGAGWPVKLAAHPLGHGARDVYLDEAFGFFDEAGRHVIPQGLVHVKFTGTETAPLADTSADEAARIRERAEIAYRETYRDSGHRRWFFDAFDTRFLFFFIARWTPDARLGGTYAAERRYRVPRTPGAERALGVSDAIRQYEVGDQGVKAGMSVTEVEAVLGKPAQRRELGPVGSFDYSYPAACVRFLGFKVAHVTAASCGGP
jgi:predicted esterase